MPSVCDSFDKAQPAQPDPLIWRYCSPTSFWSSSTSACPPKPIPFPSPGKAGFDYYLGSLLSQNTTKRPAEIAPIIASHLSRLARPGAWQPRGREPAPYRCHYESECRPRAATRRLRLPRH
jgi:hypothetical protein